MHDFTVVVLSGAFPSAVAATVDLLRATARLAPDMGFTAPAWRVCSVHGGVVLLRGGLSVQTRRLPVRARADRSTWVLPGLGEDSIQAVQDRLDDEDVRRLLGPLARHVSGGGRLAASCASVFVLQRAGLLGGRRATTSWWLAAALQALEPGCRVEAEHMVCADGPLVTAGAAFAQVDLMLHLLRVRYGAGLTRALSRALLVDGRLAQARYVVPEVLANGDELVSRVVDAVEQGLADPPSVPELAALFGISDRTLARRVKDATGLAPLSLVNAVRVRRAGDLLAGTTMTVEQVARAVGYGDATALRRTTMRLLGVPPSALRG